jgi:hypothetical protein
MITVTKMALGASAVAAAGMVAVTQQSIPEMRDVQVFKTDRDSIGESWAPECEAVLAKGDTCVFKASYIDATGPKARYITVEKREGENTSVLIRLPVTETSSR